DDPEDGDDGGRDETGGGQDAEGAFGDGLADENENGCDGELCEELRPGAHGFAVVEKADEVDEEGCGQEEYGERSVEFHAREVRVQSPPGGELVDLET